MTWVHVQRARYAHNAPTLATCVSASTGRAPGPGGLEGSREDFALSLFV